MLNKLMDMITSGQVSDLITKGKWDSLVINRRQPITYRLFARIDDLRICLYKFKPCDKHESFYHPHPWPAAFFVLSGSYMMELGKYSYIDSLDSVNISKMQLGQYSSYEMIDPLLGHSISPVTDTYTIMINGPEYTHRHKECRRTKGKDLERMEEQEKRDQLLIFDMFINLYRRTYLCNKTKEVYNGTGN